MPASDFLDIIVRAKDQAKSTLNKTSKEILDIDKSAKRSTKGLNNLDKSLFRLEKSFDGVRRSISRLSGAAITFFTSRAIIHGLQNLIHLSNEQAKAVEGMNTALRSMGRYTPELSTKLQDMASSLQKVSNYGDEAVIEGIKFLATYRDITNELLPRSIKAMADLATLQGGNMVSAANTLGKASMGLIGSLTRIGITVDKAAYKQKGYLGLLEQIESQVKGQAEAQRRATGSLQAFGNVIADVKEKLGTVLKESLEPIVRAFIDYVYEIDSKLKQLKRSGDLGGLAEKIEKSFLNSFAVIIKGAALVSDAFYGWKLILNGLTSAFALFASTVNNILAGISDGIDFVRIKYKQFGDEIANSKIIKLLQFLPGFDMLPRVLKLLDEEGVKVGEVSGKLRENAKYWEDVLRNAVKANEELAKQGSMPAFKAATKTVDALKKKVKEYRDLLSKPIDLKNFEGEAKKPQASETAIAKSAAERAAALMQTEMVKLKSLYDKRAITIKEFYDKKEELAKKAFESELSYLQKSRNAEKDVDKKLGIEDKIYKLRQKYEQLTISLANERKREEEDLANTRKSIEKSLSEGRLQILEDENANIESIYMARLELLKREQEEEISELEKSGAEKAQIEEKIRQQSITRDKLFLEKRLKIQSLYIDGTKEMLSNLNQAFGDLYQASNQETKEFFYAQKAIALAQTMISVYEGVQKAFTAYADKPALAAAIAATVLASGLARVAVIKAQKVATGGEIEGHSPTPTADNVPIWATAGEYMMPVNTVKHYGLQAMDALRSMSIPKEVFSGISGIKLPRTSRPNYAAGGEISRRVAPTAPKVIVNMKNETGQPIEAQQKGSEFDGEQLVADIVLKKFMTSRSYREAFRGR